MTKNRSIFFILLAALSFLQRNDPNFGSFWTHDNYVTKVSDYESKSYISGGNPGSWLQITFETTYYTTKVVLEGKKSCCQHRLTNLEVRIGMEDTKDMDLGMLDVNEVCHSGYVTNTGSTLDYDCPHPLKGVYLTLQKIQPLSGHDDPYAFTISEILVHAFTVDY